MDKTKGQYYLQIDRGLGMGYIWHQGRISLENLNDSLIEMKSNPHFGSITRGMTDVRQSKGMLTSEDIRSHVSFVARQVPKDRRIKWAIIAQTNLSYGLARMFDILADMESINVEIQVFKDPHEANVWLGIKEKRHVS